MARLSFLVMGTCALLLGGCLKEDPFLTACESVLKERLAAPATFKRIDFNTSKKAIPLSRIESNPNIAKRREEAGVKASEHTMFLTYDAQNRMGVPLRSTVACTYETSGSDTSDASRFSVKVSGMTHTEWLVDQLAKSRSRR
jgi:hypothetical protein